MITDYQKEVVGSVRIGGEMEILEEVLETGVSGSIRARGEDLERRPVGGHLKVGEPGDGPDSPGRRFQDSALERT